MSKNIWQTVTKFFNGGVWVELYANKSHFLQFGLTSAGVTSAASEYLCWGFSFFSIKNNFPY